MRPAHTGGILDYRLESVVLTLLAFFFLFEHAIVAVAPAFGLVDEAFALLAIATILVGAKRLDSSNRWGILCCVALAIVGLVGNIMFRLLVDVPAICVDVLSTFKVIAPFYFVYVLRPDKSVLEQTMALGVFVAKVFVVIAFSCMIASQIVDFGMTAGIRYGFKSFAFVFDGIPGNFSKVFYLIVPLLFYGIRNSSGLGDKLLLCMALLTWCSTMRSRAFAFAACTILLAIVLFRVRPNRRFGVRIRPVHIVVLGCIVLAIVWEQLVFYFTNETQARANLLKYAIVTAQTYFPIGSGFGTFGSNVAAEQYSPLYIQYGFDMIWGMSSSEGMFLNDNYWPMIIGQFGLIGFILVSVILAQIFKKVIKPCKNNTCVYISALLLVGYLLLSSVASKSYSEFSSMGVFLYMGVLSLLMWEKREELTAEIAGVQ